MKNKKENKIKYVPKSYSEDNSNEKKYSEEEIKKATEIVEQEEEKKTSKLAIVSAAWTLLSTLYAIVSTCIFIAKGWVNDTFSLVLLIMLIVYIIIFIVLVCLTIRDPKKTKASVALYKKLLSIFKAFANVVFLVLSAVSMAGLAGNSMGLKEWVAFIVTFAVAIVQLGFKVSMLVFKYVRKGLTKHYKVKITRYVDGKKKKKNIVDSLEESTYK